MTKTIKYIILSIVLLLCFSFIQGKHNKDHDSNLFHYIDSEYDIAKRRKRKKRKKRKKKRSERLVLDPEIGDILLDIEKIYRELSIRDKKRAIYYNLMEWSFYPPQSSWWSFLTRRGNFWREGNMVEKSIASFLHELKSAYEDPTNESTYKNKEIKKAIKLWLNTIHVPPLTPALFSIHNIKLLNSKVYSDYVTDWVKAQALPKVLNMDINDIQLVMCIAFTHAILVEIKKKDSEIYDITIYNAGPGCLLHEEIIRKYNHDTYFPSKRYGFPTLLFEEAKLNEKDLTVFLETILTQFIGNLELDENFEYVMTPSVIMTLFDRSEAITRWYNAVTAVLTRKGREANVIESKDTKRRWHKTQRGPSCSKKPTSLWMRENFDPVLYRAIKLNQAEEALKELREIEKEEKQEEDKEITNKLIEKAKQKIVTRKSKLFKEQQYQQLLLKRQRELDHED